MPELLQRFWAWYAAPWRTLNRKDFGIALAVVSLPSLVMAFFSLGGAGGFIGPALDMMAAVKGIGAGDASGLEALSALGGGAAEEPGVNVMAVVNTLLLMAMFPLVRMRLRDMGHYGRQELGWAIAIHVALVNQLAEAVFGWAPVPMGWLWSVINFGGYVWLSMAKGKPRLAVNQRMDYSLAEKTENRPERNDDNA